MKVFITGAAGYIGGSVAARLLQEGYTVRGLVRTAAQAEKVRQLGIEPVIGTLDDACLLYTSPSPRDVEESRMPSSA